MLCVLSCNYPVHIQTFFSCEGASSATDVSLRLLDQGLRRILGKGGVISADPNTSYDCENCRRRPRLYLRARKSKHAVVRFDSSGICGRHKQLELHFRARCCLACDVDVSCKVQVPHVPATPLSSLPFSHQPLQLPHPRLQHLIFPLHTRRLRLPKRNLISIPRLCHKAPIRPRTRTWAFSCKRCWS